MRTQVSVLLVVAALVAGCGSDDDEEPTVALAGEITTSSPSLAGTYERRLTRADIERTDHLRDESLSDHERPQPGRSSSGSKRAR